MRLPTCSLRQLIAVIAILAVILAGGSWFGKTWTASRRHRDRAKSELLYESLERYTARQANDGSDSERKLIALLTQIARTSNRVSSDKDSASGTATLIERSKIRTKVRDADAAYYLRMAEYHAQLYRKYDLYARRPWMCVEPDPPEPLDDRKDLIPADEPTPARIDPDLTPNPRG